MSDLETNLKNTRPRPPHHLETEAETTSTRSRPRPKKSVSKHTSLFDTTNCVVRSFFILQILIKIVELFTFEA